MKYIKIAFVSLCIASLFTLFIGLYIRDKSGYVTQNEFDYILNELEQLKTDNEALEDELFRLAYSYEVTTERLNAKISELEAENLKRIEVKDILNLSEDEIDLLERLVKCEAGGEPFETKVVVCVVIFNRMYDSNFKSSLNEVIYEKGQFSPAIEGTIETAVPTEDCKFAVKIALSLTYSEINEDYGSDLMFFRKATKEKVFGTNTSYAFTVGNTDFYRLTKH